MPIHAPTLLTDLKRWVTRFEDDLRQQCKDVPALDARLKAQYKLAKDAGRTAFSYAVWRDGELTQSAVGWVLSCVFVRFLEDNDLLERTFLSGIGENRDLAEETRAAWFRENRAASDNDYLAHVIAETGKLPGMADLMDARHNALWNAPISPDAAKAIIEFWRRIDPGTGKLAHEFTDPDWDTRFLGDLYQDLSESARKKFALLQTPDFVEKFILDRTLDPALNVFGLKVVRMIDPTCGSGHFLLGAFRRLLRLWENDRPDLSERELAVKALEGVFGVDINPFAVAIARFRLLLAAWRYCGVKLLKSAPDFKVNLATGDSLLHGARFDSQGKPYVVHRESLFPSDEVVFKDETAHHFAIEDSKELHRILGQQYHAVVGNPPYINVDDNALNQLYRQRYASCYREYALSVPFMERFFDLALTGSVEGREPAGFTGQITANSFMKAEFGKKLIEEFIPRWDLTHVLDTSGAFIPGHGTPTVILFGRNARPATSIVRTVMGLKSEPSTPDERAEGKVWSSIVDQVDRPCSESEFISTVDVDREKFHQHPWSIGGGAAITLKLQLDDSGFKRLDDVSRIIGYSGQTNGDEVFRIPSDSARRHRLIETNHRRLVYGDVVRDFSIKDSDHAVFPYSKNGLRELHEIPDINRYFWSWRNPLGNRRTFSKRSYFEEGRPWWEWHQIALDRLLPPERIAFAFVATHNHFVFDRNGLLFKQSAPFVALAKDATEDDYLSLFGILNSSISWFWGKQCYFERGGYAEGKWQERVNVNAALLAKHPLPSSTPLNLARELVHRPVNRCASDSGRILSVR